MWKYGVILLCLSGYCLAGPVGLKKNMPIGLHQRANDAASSMESTMAESESTSTAAASEPSSAEMMIMSSLTLPSNATSIRSEITDNFSCANKTYGYYADVDNDCQIFHVCLPVTYADGKENTFRWSFICPEETVFSQDSFTCMRPEDMTITCEDSLSYYELNRNFGMVESEGEKENNEKPAAEAAEEMNENQPEVMEPVVIKTEPVRPVEQVNKVMQKPMRRKPALAYATQKKPMRKVPQTQPEMNSIVSEQEIIDTSEPLKPSVQEEEIKPVVQKIISRRPVPVMSNSFKDKLQNSKIDTTNSLRSDLFNQKRKRPTMFNKKPADQPAVEQTEQPAEEPALEETQKKVTEQRFSPMESDMSNSNIASQVADSKIEGSQIQEVYLKPEETPEEEIAAQIPIQSEAEYPAQVLEAFEEIPAVIAEVMESTQAEEDKPEQQISAAEDMPKNEDSISSDVDSETSQDSAMAQATIAMEEELQSAEETQHGQETLKLNEEVPETQNAEEDHIHEDNQTAKETPNAEEIPNSQEIQTAEEIMNAEEPKPAEEPNNGDAETQDINEAIEETQNVEEVQAAQEMPTVEETHHSEEEIQTADQNPKEEEQKNGEAQTVEETHMVESAPDMENTKLDEEAQIMDQAAEESEIVEETLTTEEIPKAEESQASEDMKTEEETEQKFAAEAIMENEASGEAMAIQNSETEPEEVKPIDDEFIKAEEISPMNEVYATDDKLSPEESQPDAEMEQTKSTDVEMAEQQPAMIPAGPAIFEENSEEAAAPAALQTLEEMEAEKPDQAPESMPATEEMSQQDPIVQQMFQEKNEEDDNKKQTIGGFKPVDPVMAAEAEQLIADFINTLRNNDFANEKPGMPIMEIAMNQEPEKSMESDDVAQPQIIETPVYAEEDKTVENEEDSMNNQEEKDTAQSMDIDKASENNEMGSLKSSEVSEEPQQSDTMPVQVPEMIMSHMPEHIYQIPVEVVASEAEEVMPDMHQQIQSEEQTNTIAEEMPIQSNEDEPHEMENPAVLMGGYKPLSIDDIVELVKERLDQKPQDELETPMQLEQVLNEAQPNVEEEASVSAGEAEQTAVAAESQEEIVMPIYHRLAEPTKVDAGVQTDIQDESSVAAEEEKDMVAAPSTNQEKSNRSYRSRSMLSAKLDPRKRRFLFRSDES
uniref:Chitin-binding type-2 domain-containing protein n=1 Tax=Stomoxys calcitrans TaxID=35570 RepID=A0A1I8PQ48_STOCA